MALLRKQADLVSGGFYILEEPTDLLQRYLVGPLVHGKSPKSTKIGQFKGFNLGSEQQLGAPLFVLSERELKEFLVLGSHSTDSALFSLGVEEKKAYKKTFSQVQKKMKKTDLSKAVLYTKVEQDLHDFISVEAFTFLASMGMRNKKSGYLFGFYNPKEETALLGCSPEFLFKTNQGGELVTTAVAGTQKTSEEMEWSDKLLKEHEVVMQGVNECLDGKVKWTAVDNFNYGALSHLKSEGVMESSVKVESLSERLHPTPAIGTLPRSYSKDLELGPEGRGYFGGYVELLEYERPFSLVSIRCFEWESSRVQVCIGGGVLKESLAEKEWTELEDKWTTFKAIWEI
ncbi:MAG: chorismate-binding protein [Bdellovibrionales bacterium]